MTLQSVLFLTAIRKNLHKTLHAFTFFLGWMCVHSFDLLFISQRFGVKTYLYVYYFGLLIETVLLVLIVREVFSLVFTPWGSLPAGVISNVFSLITTVSALIVFAAVWHPANTPDPLFAGLRTAHRTVQSILCLAFWIIVLYARVLGIPWRSRLADITSGFLLYLTFQSFTSAIIGFASRYWVAQLSRIATLSYIGALLFWVASMREQKMVFEVVSDDELSHVRSLVEAMVSTTSQLSKIIKSRAS